MLIEAVNRHIDLCRNMGFKYKVQAGLFRRMIEAEKPLYLDFRDAFALAREIVG